MCSRAFGESSRGTISKSRRDTDFLRLRFSPQMASSRERIASNILAAEPSRPFSNASSALDRVSGRRFLTGLVRRPSARRYEFADMGCAFMGAQYRILEFRANLLWEFWIRRKFLKFLRRAGAVDFNR